jgi:hypothetical protein
MYYFRVSLNHKIAEPYASKGRFGDTKGNQILNRNITERYGRIINEWVKGKIMGE